MKLSLRSRRRKEADARVRSCSLCCLVFISGIASALAQPPSALRPSYGEIGPSFWEQYSTLVIIAAFAAVVLAVVLTVLFMLPKSNPAESPLGAARRGLAGLQNRTEDGTLIMEVSQIFRRYVIFAFNLPSEELTTAELTRSLQCLQKSDSTLTTEVVNFFRQCDEDKFSSPALPPRMNVASRALQLLNRIEAHRRQTLLQQPA